jgi:aminobenzoyl-glutamate utilization protein A
MSGLDRFVAEREASLVDFRRSLHREPELGFTEYRTASRIAARLHELGYALRVGRQAMVEASMLGRPPASQIEARLDRLQGDATVARWRERMPEGMTAVVGEIRRGPGPVVALRFDMDALPIAEADDATHLPAREGFRSQNPGVHHACGHDGHAAIGIGLAEWLVRDEARWRGTVRLLFQPAEEGGRGALPMAEAGVADDADWLFAAHLGCHLDTGTVAACATHMLYSTKLDATFAGRAAHAGANPELGRNALLAGATATLNLHALPRYAGAATRVNVGKLVAGVGRNVIADHCRMEMEVRGETLEAAEFMAGRARAILESAAHMHEVACEIARVGETCAARCDAEAVALVERVAGRIVGVDRVLHGAPLGGGEDAPFLMRRAQDNGGKACYFLIGSTLADCHHSPHFDFDERSLGIGVKLFAGIVEEATSSP